MEDPFATALGTEEELRAIYPEPPVRAWEKDVGRLDALARQLIAASRMVVVASISGDGRLDVTPRGGPTGFARVLDERRLAIPDATGNRRIDTLRNVVGTGRAGLIFLIAGATPRCA